MTYEDEIIRILSSRGTPMTKHQIYSEMNVIAKHTIDKMVSEGKLSVAERITGNHFSYDLSDQTFDTWLGGRRALITDRQKTVLELIYSAESGITPMEIQRKTEIASPQLTSDVQKMKGYGLIYKERRGDKSYWRCTP